MPTPPVLVQERVSRKKPMPFQDNIADGVPSRGGRYGEDYALTLISKNHLLADEGSYFTATNPTPGTGISTAATADSSHALPTPGGNADLNPYFVIFNSAQPGDQAAPRVYLDSLQMLVTAAGTNGTAINCGIQLDMMSNRIKQGAAVGGTSITPINPNMDDGTKSVVQMWAGANTVLASAGAAGAGFSVRMLPHRQFRPVIPVVGDVYALSFGAAEQFVGSLISSGTAICQQSFNYPPVVIGPGQVALIFLWLPSQTVASAYEFDLNWWER